ncbi:hypothetical protein ACEWY4_012050 [Coilia grayii]|uniref:Uncharacterized protein n=1 Tax=Coilia grayii TaxID=363190 RepID=A0ABD1JZE2_9TELE
MDLPGTFKQESEAMMSAKLGRSCSPEHSQISERTDHSMDLPRNFTGESDISISELFTRLLSEDQFWCPICKEVLEDPVCIPCGHSYCRLCITSDWEQPNKEGVFACSQCQETYSTRPQYYVNSVVVEVLKRGKYSPVLPARSYARPGDVVCDFCTGRRLRAVKFCVTCIAFYCETHIREHYSLYYLESHKLLEATESLKKWLCLKHHAILDVLCQTDNFFICSYCALLEHNSHDIKIVDSEELLMSSQMPKASVSLPTGAVGSPVAASPFPQITTPPSGRSPGSSRCSSDLDPKRPQKIGKEGFYSRLEDIKSDRRVVFETGLEKAHGERLKNVQGCSPTPSQDSVKTNRSKDLPENFRDESEAFNRLKIMQGCSPTPSQDSVKTHRSKNLPENFRDESETFKSLKLERSSLPEHSQISERTDHSMDLPGNFKEESDISIRLKNVQGCSPTPSQDSVKTNRSKDLPENVRDESEAFKSLKLERSSSPEHSQISERTDHSMDLQGNFREESDISISGLLTRLLSEDQFRCPICKEVLEDPVCIPCGHSYCRLCIASDWEKPNKEGVFACSQCQETYSTRPQFYVNSVVVEVLKKANSSAGPGDVVCDFCTGKKLKAVKSCLTCIASYCEFHIRKHSASVMQWHRLLEATAELEKWLCPEHHLVLDVFCQTDQFHICRRCALLEHNGHDMNVVSYNEPLMPSQMPKASVSSARGSRVAASPFQGMKTPPSGLSSGPSQYHSYDSDPRGLKKKRKEDFYSTVKVKSARRLTFDEQDDREQSKD